LAEATEEDDKLGIVRFLLNFSSSSKMVDTVGANLR